MTVKIECRDGNYIRHYDCAGADNNGRTLLGRFKKDLQKEHILDFIITQHVKYGKVVDQEYVSPIEYDVSARHLIKEEKERLKDSLEKTRRRIKGLSNHLGRKRLEERLGMLIAAVAYKHPINPERL